MMKDEAAAASSTLRPRHRRLRASENSSLVIREPSSSGIPHSLRHWSFLILSSFVISHSSFPQACAQEGVTLKAVKYPELGQLVRQHQGKVVVVDLWATW
jgi:hypothetical protein